MYANGVLCNDRLAGMISVCERAVRDRSETITAQTQRVAQDTHAIPAGRL